MVRQYIGARYVPKFFENPNNTAEWLPNVIYEPLTIVTYGSNSYTSKKTVPASVGDPSNNPDYWVATGNYSAYISELNGRVDTLDGRVDTLDGRVDTLDGKVDTLDGRVDTLDGRVDTLDGLIDKPKVRKYILIGDSFGAGIDGDNNTQAVSGGGWIARFSALHPNDTYSTNVARVGVSGFASSAPFLQQLQDIESQIADKNVITDIIVFGGTNDIPFGGTSALTNAISTFVNYVKANYPNATITVGVLGSNQIALRDVVNDYRTILNYGGVYIPLTNLFCDNQYVGADGTHLNANGYAFYQPYITNAIHTLTTDFEFLVTTGILENEHYFFKLKVTPNDVQAWLSWDDVSVFMSSGDLVNTRLTPLNLHKIYPYKSSCQHLIKYELNDNNNYSMSPIAILSVQIDIDGFISFQNINNIAPSFGGTVRTLQMDISPARTVNS